MADMRTIPINGASADAVKRFLTTELGLEFGTVPVGYEAHYRDIFLLLRTSYDDICESVFISGKGDDFSVVSAVLDRLHSVSHCAIKNFWTDGVSDEGYEIVAHYRRRLQQERGLGRADSTDSSSGDVSQRGQ